MAEDKKPKRLKIEYVSVSKLMPYEKNPRKTRHGGLDKLVKSIEQFGWTNPILVQNNTNMIIAGHQRLKAAEAAGIKEVPVVYLDLDDATAKAYNIADNKLAEDVADWNKVLLGELLDELQDSSIDLTITGFSAAEIDKYISKFANKAALDVVAEEWNLEGEIYRPCWIVIRGRDELYPAIMSAVREALAPFGVSLEGSGGHDKGNS